MNPLLIIRFDVFVHNDPSVSDVKLDVLTKLVQQLGEKLMAKSDELQDDVEALRVAMDAATDEIARDLDALRNDLNSQLEGGLTAEQATALKGSIAEKLGGINARLVALGKDPITPVP